MLWTLSQLVGPELPALAVGGLAATAVPLVIHLLAQLRRRPQAWGAMLFLIEAYRRHRGRLRLEHWLLLVTRCLILAVLGLALSGPGLHGCSPGAVGGRWASAQRMVFIVLDDSLSTHSDGLCGRQRFDHLRDTAVRIVDALGPTDRVAVLRAAYPAIQIPASEGPLGRSVEISSSTTSGPFGTIDHRKVRRQLAEIRPRYSRAELVTALSSIHSALQHPSVADLRVSDRVVIVLSDWAKGALDLQHPPPPELAALAKRSRLVITRPAPPADNVQWVSVRPHRFMVLREQEGQTAVPVELKLQRFVGQADQSQVSVQLVARDTSGKPQSEPIRRDHPWAAGQTVAVFNVQVPFGPGEGVTPDDRATFIIEAQLGAPPGSDAIDADNRRWAIVELRSRLRVGVIDRLGAAPVEDTVFTPRQWISIALAPTSAAPAGLAESGVELVNIGPDDVSEPHLSQLDAAMLMRPDLIKEVGWEALGQFARRGGLVWFFMPPGDSPAVWAVALRRDFGLDWHLGMESRIVGGPDGDGLTLAADLPTPELLDMLAADWSALIKPLRVTRRYDLAVPGGSDQIWLATSDAVVDGADDSAKSEPFLVSAEVAGGSPTSGFVSAAVGRVILIAAALDTSWTNLPTKPLLVPLLHESLRSALGQSSEVARLSALSCGDRPLLGGQWTGAEQVKIGSGTGQDQVPLQRTDAGALPAAPLARPGVYRTEPPSSLRLAVNVDPKAGDTRAIDSEALGRWMSPLADWQWLDEDDPTSVLSESSTVVRLGWPLLWAVLALLLVETYLARWFSHAQLSDGGWRQRLSQLLGVGLGRGRGRDVTS